MTQHILQKGPFTMIIIIAVFVTLAVTLAPIGSAWATLHAAATKSDVLSADMSAMTDCEKMMKGADKQPDRKSDCPCCESNAACAPEFCLSKCFQLLGAVPRAQHVAVLTRLNLRPAETDPPPDWSYRPPPPPPRT